MEISVQGKAVFAATGGRPYDPAQPAVVFLHGAGMDHTVWALQTRYFAYRARSVLALDLPGHGKSEGPELETVPAMADWLISVLDALGIERAALVGHSMGAFIALDGAARHGARVSRLALLGVASRMAVHPDLLTAAEADDHLAIDLVRSSTRVTNTRSRARSSCVVSNLERGRGAAVRRHPHRKRTSETLFVGGTLFHQQWNHLQQHRDEHEVDDHRDCNRHKTGGQCE